MPPWPIAAPPWWGTRPVAAHEADVAPATRSDPAPPALPDDIIDLIHCLGFVYLRHGQSNRAVVLLIFAAQDAPDRVDVLRTLVPR